MNTTATENTSADQRTCPGCGETLRRKVIVKRDTNGNNFLYSLWGSYDGYGCGLGPYTHREQIIMKGQTP